MVETSEGGAVTEFLVFLDEQADLSGARHLTTKEARGRYVFERLAATAAATQPPVVAELARFGVRFHRFWVANMIWVRGGREVARAMAERPDVARVSANPAVALERVAPAEAIGSSEAIEWNVLQIGAPDFWAAGFTGQGVVVAGQDTGYEWDHPALKQQYRGWDGAAADHNYNWHDAIHVPNGDCPADSPEPCADQSHGTHTMGTMVGDDGGGNQIGVAPAARWIGCRNMNEGVGTPATYSECFQFFIAPTDLAGQNPDPARAPHVVNNSWSCPPSEGCTDPNALRTVVENVRAAGILVAVSAGNAGPGCESVDNPAGIYEASHTVGATDSNDAIAPFSSRGAVDEDGSFRLKPDVSAPGVSVRSSVRFGNYSSFSGTSMAAPHVAGQVALLISAAPALAGDVDRLEACTEATAVPRTSTQDCSGVPGGSVPNNTYGWGRIRLALPLPPVCQPPALIFSDGFESGDTSAWSG